MYLVGALRVGLQPTRQSARWDPRLCTLPSSSSVPSRYLCFLSWSHLNFFGSSQTFSVCQTGQGLRWRKGGFIKTELSGPTYLPSKPQIRAHFLQEAIMKSTKPFLNNSEKWSDAEGGACVPQGQSPGFLSLILLHP